MKYKVLAISGSLRAQSSNSLMLKAVANLVPGDMEFEIFEGIGDLPHFNPDIDGDKSPESVRAYREKLRWADGVLICTPEYAYGMPGVLKNALDWVVASGEFMNKPVAAISASPLTSGGNKAHASLVLTLKTISAIVPEGAMLNIPSVGKKINADAVLTDEGTIKNLKQVIQALQLAITFQKQELPV